MARMVFPQFSGSEESLLGSNTAEDDASVFGDVRVYSVNKTDPKVPLPPSQKGEVVGLIKAMSSVPPRKSSRPKLQAKAYSSFMPEGGWTPDQHREWNQARLSVLRDMRARLESFKSATLVIPIHKDARRERLKYIENRAERVILISEKSSIRIKEAELRERLTVLDEQLAKFSHLDYSAEYWIDRYGKKWKPCRAERDHARITNNSKISSLQVEKRDLGFEIQRVCKALDEVKIKICDNQRIEDIETECDPTVWIRYDGLPALKLRW